MESSAILAIVAIVERGKADRIVDQAKKVGASGATILYGRGTGEHETRKFLNIQIESSKEIIIVLAEEEKYRPIYDAIARAGNIREPGIGIMFTVPVSNLIGIEHHKDLVQNGKRI